MFCPLLKGRVTRCFSLKNHRNSIGSRLCKVIGSTTHYRESVIFGQSLQTPKNNLLHALRHREIVERIPRPNPRVGLMLLGTQLGRWQPFFCWRLGQVHFNNEVELLCRSTTRRIFEARELLDNPGHHQPRFFQGLAGDWKKLDRTSHLV